ncbi:Prokaryotic cytochrome b561 [Synechococcus sp. GFB01]|nr:Prokaryotic cytochrome b561 [Synechococcus sp. GFB01]
MPRPYQPSLLRLLHGATALLVLAAWLSGLAVYSLHDGRWGRLPITPTGDWVDLHGTAGVLLLPVAVLFAAYALTLGRRRLQRPSNALALGAVTLAIGSGKLMNEDWLRRGELHHWVYGLHLLAWLLVAGAVIVHLLGGLQLGGVAMLRSILSVHVRAGDQPRHWPGQVRAFISRP